MFKLMPSSCISPACKTASYLNVPSVNPNYVRQTDKLKPLLILDIYFLSWTQFFHIITTHCPVPGRCSFQTVSNLKSLKLKVPASEIWIGGTGRGLWRADSSWPLIGHWVRMRASDWLRLLPMSGAGGRRSGDGGRWPLGAEGVTKVICQLHSSLYFVIPISIVWKSSLARMRKTETKCVE